VKTRFKLPALVLVTAFLSVGVTARPTTVLAAPKKAPCAVCAVKEGAGPEAVKATATYNGKEYSFCSDKCKAEFLKNPEAFLKGDAPRPAPPFTLKDLSGNSVSLSDYKGKVVLLDFWATFCGPCVEAMPKLQKLSEKHASRGLAVIGIATDEEGAKVVAPMVAKTKVKYPILVSDEAAWKNYGVETLPALFLIDRKGQIVKRFGGKTDPKAVEEAVEKLLAE
jgi:peroxiredoxin